MTSDELEKKAAALGLSVGDKEIMALCKDDGTWVIIITRNGYRKALAKREDYSRHVVYPIYDNSVINIDGDKVSVNISGGMSNVMGAIGFLYKKDAPGFFMYQDTIDDHHGTSEYYKNMPHTMIMKSCEVALIRMAYPDLFANTYSEDEYTEIRETKETKDTIIKYLRGADTYEAASEIVRAKGVRLEDMTMEELRAIKQAIKEKQ